MKGNVLNIQRYCVDDGPGIRTTVFLKGCPLSCAWCHNPESQSKKTQILYDAKKCVLCGKCLNVCPKACHEIKRTHYFDSKNCIGCGECAKVCFNNALELYGKVMTVIDVFNEVKRDKVFYETSGGGVTISGGEPLSQPEFTKGILALCKKEGISTAIETSGFATKESLIKVIKHCDLILYDVKLTDEKKHKFYTGAPLSVIIDNLKTINENKVPFIIRAPIIPTVNDDENHFISLKALSQSMEYCKGVEIMPYHRLGAYKYYDMHNVIKEALSFIGTIND